VLIDILTNLASSKNDGIYKIVVEQALPPLCLRIGSAKKEEPWIPASGIDLVGSLVSGAPESGLGEGFFETLAPNLFSCLSVAEDRDALQVRFSYTEQDACAEFLRMVSLVLHLSFAKISNSYCPGLMPVVEAALIGCSLSLLECLRAKTNQAASRLAILSSIS
jgi:hypothetical protein